jgi:hypothetical membrane protein
MSTADEKVRRATTSRLLYCGLVAGPLFVLTFLVEGWTRGEGYDALRHPVSSLALGRLGWTQATNFILCGLLTILFAAGLWRSGAGRVGAVLVGLWGLGLIGAGLFPTDPVSGYPLGTPATSEYTTSGALHDGVSIPAFLALAVAQVVLARRRGRAWLVYSLLSAITFVVLLELSNLGFGQQDPFTDYAGLFQRLCVAVGWAWTVAVAVRELRR